jgi:hypothetical protein
MRLAGLRSSAFGVVLLVSTLPAQAADLVPDVVVPAMTAGAADGAAAAAGLAGLVQVRFRSREGGEIARRSALGAARRLAAPECRAVLADFSDAQGVRLDARLAAAGVSLEDWIRGVYFYDGQGQAPCQRRGVLAVTNTGGNVVYVCPAFLRQQNRDPGLAEAVMVHELLHTLGLREDPPTSREINRRVFARCGR